jgi:DNA-binding NarL/FixJ family response regulator
MTQPIRVVVANRPRFMRELVVETISLQPDIEVVAEIKNEDEIVGAVEGTHPDFLIISLDEYNRRPRLCDLLLPRYPEMKILALAPERNSSIFYWASFDIHESPEEASEAGILVSLRRKSVSAGGSL